MLDQDFCAFLEYQISSALQQLQQDEGKGYWCDGVLPLPTHDYSIQAVNRTREIILKAFIGKDGQSTYTLILKLGNRAFSRYSRNLDITAHMPDVTDAGSWNIDMTEKTMEIRFR